MFCLSPLSFIALTLEHFKYSPWLSSLDFSCCIGNFADGLFYFIHSRRMSHIAFLCARFLLMLLYILSARRVHYLDTAI